jgi:hypothetical protein
VRAKKGSEEVTQRLLAEGISILHECSLEHRFSHLPLGTRALQSPIIGNRCGMKTCFALFAAMLVLFSCATSSGSLFEDTVAVEEGEEEPKKKPPKSKEQERERDSIWAADEQEDRRKDEGWSIRIEPKEAAIFVVSYPSGAEVYLNGAYRGVTPLKIYTQKEGFYTLDLHKDGCLPLSKTIYYPGHYIRYIYNMTQLYGALQVSVEPEEAAILFNSETIQNRLSTQVPAGLNELEVSAFGYETYREQIDVAENSLTVRHIRLEKAAFTISSIDIGRGLFDPLKPGPSGKIIVTVSTTNIGTGEARIINEQNQVVYRLLLRFDSRTRQFSWNGRDSDGVPLPDGTYSLVIEAQSEYGQLPISRERKITIHRTDEIYVRSLWSGSAGLLYASSPEVLPPGSKQLSFLFQSHVSLTGQRTPANLALRLGFRENNEIDFQTGLITGLDLDDVPFFASVAWKKMLIDPVDRRGFSLAGLLKLAYQNVDTDTQTNFTGFSASIPLAYWIYELGLFFSPEVIIAPATVTFDPAEEPDEGVFTWSYLRFGIILDFESVMLGISASFRTEPFARGLGIDLPFPLAAELHWRIRDTPIVLSFAANALIRSINDYFISSGLGIGYIR